MRTSSSSILKQAIRHAGSLQIKQARIKADHNTPRACLQTLAVTLSSFCFAFIVPCYAAAEQDSAPATASTKSADKGSAFYARAVQYYQRNDFKNAELFLRQAISESPSDPGSHYYLANTLVHLNRHDEAIDEFKRSYHLDPYGPTSGYCRKALKTYEGQSTKDDTGDPLDATSSMLRYAHKQPSAADPQEKLVSLRLQAEREKVRHQQSADSYSRAINSTGEGEAQTIRQNARNEIDQIMHGTRNTQPWLEQAATARAAEVQHNADEMEKIAHERASEKAADYKALSKAKGKALDETVSNLERQLVTKTLPGSPTLRHDGTDLFVRTYAPSTQKSPYPDAHPAVARVNPVHVVPATDDDDAADGLKGTAKSLPTHDVKGKVLN